MKTFTKLWGTLALMLVVGISTYAQNSVTTPVGDLYLDGRNVSSPGTDVATEDPDLITNGTVVPYLVIPDPIPLYVPGTSLTANLVSTFDWSAAPAAGVSIATKTGMGTNIVTATWATVGSYTLSVLEKATCDATATRDIPVQVIAIPTANFSSATSTQCTSTPASQTFQLPLALTTDISSGTMMVDISIIYTPLVGAPVPSTHNNISIKEGGTLNLETLKGALAFGKYEITITKVSDRVSVKSKVAGTIGGQPTYTYNLIDVPKTGEIYHLPNI